MTIPIDREALLHKLESVEAGLSPRGVIQQSDTFVFQRGYVLTFNEEVFCKAKSGLPKEVEGAIRGATFLALLRELVEPELTLTVRDASFDFSGKSNRRGTRLFREAEISLPVDLVEKPGEWRLLPDHFLEAVNVVQRCAAADAKDKELYHVSVHLHPERIEAFDKAQYCRWDMQTGIAEPALVRQSAIKHISSLGMTEVSETPAWLHFRNADGLRLSCRRYVEDFPELGDALKAKDAVAVSLPKSLAKGMNRVRVFSAENESDVVLVEMKKGRMRVTGQGASGEHWEEPKLTYDGPPVKFFISPLLLADMIERNPECKIAADRIVVKNGSYRWVTMLGKVEENGDGEQEMSEDEKDDVGDRIDKASRRKKVAD